MIISFKKFMTSMITAGCLSILAKGNDESRNYKDNKNVNQANFLKNKQKILS